MLWEVQHQGRYWILHLSHNTTQSPAQIWRSTEYQEDIKEDSKERYLSYVLIRQSVKQHNKLKIDLQNNFTIGDDRMTKKSHTTLHLMDRYNKNTVVIQPTSEVVLFYQKGDSNKKKYERYEKEVWKYKKYHNCGKTAQQVSHCRSNSKQTPDKNQDEEN